MSFQTRKQSSVPQTKENYPRIRHKQNNAKSAAFCGFCVFAGKNAVYLANQSCKDGKSKALCHKPKLCATKNRHNYPKNSAQAEFLCFCTRLLVKHEFPDAKAKLCATGRSSVPCIVDIFFLFCRLIMFFH